MKQDEKEEVLSSFFNLCPIFSVSRMSFCFIMISANCLRILWCGAVKLLMHLFGGKGRRFSNRGRKELFVFGRKERSILMSGCSNIKMMLCCFYGFCVKN